MEQNLPNDNGDVSSNGLEFIKGPLLVVWFLFATKEEKDDWLSTQHLPHSCIVLVEGRGV